ncbi:MAG TPA: hypothetical protein VMV94_14590 [Phycisphaerae bacterium]|nr:hypothetical protein [Phycisphaerae bacterium]
MAGIMGAIAGDTYRPAYELRGEGLVGFGFCWGAVTGVIAGIIWSCVMITLATPKRREKLARIGALIGIAVGVISAALLHAGLMLLTGERETWLMRLGIALAIPIGAVVGGISGGAYRSAFAVADTDGTPKATVVAPPMAQAPRSPSDTTP